MKTMSGLLRRFAHTITGAPKVNYFPHLSKRKNAPLVTQDRGPLSAESRETPLQGFRSSIKDPDYKYEYRYNPSSPSSPRVIPAEGSTPFATPDYDPVRNSLKDPEYSKIRPQTGREF